MRSWERWWDGGEGEGERGVHWKALCCPAEQKIVVQWSNYTCRCSHIYDNVSGLKAESRSPWSSLVSVPASQGPFASKLVQSVTAAAVSTPPAPCTTNPPPPCPRHSPSSSAISLSLMPSTVGSEMRAWPRLPAPGAQFTMAGEKLSGPKSQRKTGGLECCHLRHRRCGSSHLCNFFNVLTHSCGTIYTLLMWLSEKIYPNYVCSSFRQI